VKVSKKQDRYVETFGIA